MKNIILTLKILAFSMVIILISQTANSQKILSTFNSAKSASILSSSLQSNNENDLILNSYHENWMSNKSYLDNQGLDFNFYVMIALNEKVVEYNRNIEDWMIKDKRWTPLQVKKLEDCQEELRMLEEWMCDENFWVIKPKRCIDEIIEDSRAVEDWMLSDKFWVTVN